MSLSRVKVNNKGGPGGAATTNFYFSTISSTELGALATFFNAVKALLPSTITYEIPGSGDVIDEGDGHLTGSWSSTGATSVVGTGTGIQSTPTGIEIAWLAADVVDGHRPVGKTLLVPATASAYSGNGTIAPASVTTCNNAGATFLATAVNFKIWHRPRKADPKADPPVTFRSGLAMTPGGVSTRSAPTVLRSRRQ